MTGARPAVGARQLEEADIPQAAIASAEAFGLDLTPASVRRRWEERLRHSLRSDPRGSFVTERRPTVADRRSTVADRRSTVADRGSTVTGLAQAVIRDGIWILSLMTVSPTLGTGGEGRALMQAVLSYYHGCRGGLIVSSNDPRALRLYGSSGFALEPTFRAEGRPDLSLMPELRQDILPIGPAGFEALAPVSFAVRGAAHTRDLEIAIARGGSIFGIPDGGFVVTIPGRGIWMLAARDERIATALLWFGLHELRDEPRVEISWVSARQQWALEVMLAARLSLSAYGGIASRGVVGPLHPYIPSSSFA